MWGIVSVGNVRRARRRVDVVLEDGEMEMASCDGMKKMKSSLE